MKHFQMKSLSLIVKKDIVFEKKQIYIDLFTKKYRKSNQAKKGKGSFKRKK